jgi:hypothetical protein
MSDIDNDETNLSVDELASLKARADMLGVKYHPSISLEKLRDKVKAAMSEDAPAVEEEEVAVVVPAAVVETESQRKARKRKEANELVRVRITCMNPAKAEWEGEIFTAGNSTVGSFTKFVPFNADEGWHVPRIILSQIQERQCQIFTSVRDSRGNSTRKGKLIKEFAIEIMPPLTTEELAELARRQAVTRAVQ